MALQVASEAKSKICEALSLICTPFVDALKWLCKSVTLVRLATSRAEL